MIEVQKVYECTHGVFKALIMLPDISAEPVTYNITRDPDHDDAPVYQELCQRLNDGEFDSIIEPCPELSLDISAVRTDALRELSENIRVTEDRILGRVPKQMRIDFSSSLERCRKESTVKEALESAIAQLGDLTPSDAE